MFISNVHNYINPENIFGDTNVCICKNILIQRNRLSENLTGYSRNAVFRVETTGWLKCE